MAQYYDESLESLDSYFEKFENGAVVGKEIRTGREIESWQGKVSIGNKLLEASFDLEVGERRFLHYCLTMVNSTKALADDIEFTITAGDFAFLLDVDYQTAYSALNKAVETIVTRYVVIKGVEYEGKTEIPWFKEVRKNKNVGAVTVIWNERLLPYISNLGKLQSFTRLVNKESLHLSSKYSARLYELLSIERWKGSSGELAIDIEELYNRWQIPQYARNYNELRKSILLPAIDELKRKDIIDIQLEVPKYKGKVGRKIVRIAFKYTFQHSLSDYGLVSKNRFGKTSQDNLIL